MSLLSLATFGVFEQAGAAPQPVLWQAIDHVPSFLTHRCVIEEKSVSGTDGGGHAIEAWVTKWENVPCQLVSPGARRLVREMKEASLADYRLLLPMSLTVLEFEMRVKSVVDEWGRPVVGRAADVYEIEGQPSPMGNVGGGVQSVGLRLAR